MPFIEMTVMGVGIDPGNDAPVVILKSRDGAFALPIWIGENEAWAISRALEGRVPERPMAHDLLKSLLEGLGAGFDKALITEVRDEVFYARINLRHQGRYISADARPSDSIVLALKFQAPILADRKVLEHAIALAPGNGGETLARRLRKMKPGDLGEFNL
jgi:uncharacterized protein